MQKILIIGASGFVGNRLLELIDIKKNDVYAISRDINYKKDGIKFIYGNFSDEEVILSVLKIKADILIDLAAYIPSKINNSFENESTDIINENLLNHMKLVKRLVSLKKIIYISTIDVYGSNGIKQFKEDFKLNPVSFYASGKASLEFFYNIYAKQKEIPLFVLRFAQVYGPGDTHKKIISIIIDAFKNNLVLKLKNDGNEKRRYLYIDDAVNSIIKCLDSKKPNTYNIAGDEITKILKIIKILEKVTKNKIKIESFKGDDVDLVMDNSKFKNDVKFKYKTSLTEGLKKIWIEIK